MYINLIRFESAKSYAARRPIRETSNRSTHNTHVIHLYLYTRRSIIPHKLFGWYLCKEQHDGEYQNAKYMYCITALAVAEWQMYGRLSRPDFRESHNIIIILITIIIQSCFILPQQSDEIAFTLGPRSASCTQRIRNTNTSRITRLCLFEIKNVKKMQ